MISSSNLQSCSSSPPHTLGSSQGIRRFVLVSQENLASFFGSLKCHCSKSLCPSYPYRCVTPSILTVIHHLDVDWLPRLCLQYWWLMMYHCCVLAVKPGGYLADPPPSVSQTLACSSMWQTQILIFSLLYPHTYLQHISGLANVPFHD